MITALPRQPHYHENENKNIKCKHMVEYIVGINIWSRGISLGGVENAVSRGELGCHGSLV